MNCFEQGNVVGFLHQPGLGSGGGLALTHGAGGNCEAPSLVKVAGEFCAQGWTVLRYELPFRQHRRSGPPSPHSAASDQAGVRDAVAQIRTLTTRPIVAGGHSYGGRQTTMLAAKEPDLCGALVAFSYPLHPPKRPDQLRTAHFPELRIPVLFVHGTADPFGTPEEMQTEIRAIPAKTKLLLIDGAGHDLRGGKIDVPMIVSELKTLLEGA